MDAEDRRKPIGKGNSTTVGEELGDCPLHSHHALNRILLLDVDDAVCLASQVEFNVVEYRSEPVFSALRSVNRPLCSSVDVKLIGFYSKTVLENPIIRCMSEVDKCVQAFSSRIATPQAESLLVGMGACVPHFGELVSLDYADKSL